MAWKRAEPDYYQPDPDELEQILKADEEYGKLRKAYEEVIRLEYDHHRRQRLMELLGDMNEDHK